MRVPKTDLVLIIEPLLIVWPPTNIEHPLLEALLHLGLITIVRFSLRVGEIVSEMGRLADYITPRINDCPSLILKHIACEMKLMDIFVGQSDCLFQLLQFFK